MLMDKKWYLVQCKPRESFRAAMHLNNQGYTCFHPTYPVKRNNKRKLITIIEPLFPYYLFVLLNAESKWSPIRSTRGVSKIVHFNSKPAALPFSLVQALQERCARLNGQKPECFLKPGDKVLITEGCFKEIEAIVTAESGEERVVLMINLFNRQNEITLPLHAVKVCA